MTLKTITLPGALGLGLAALPAVARADSQVCYTAEPVPLGMSYHVGNGISAPGHALQFLAFQPPAGGSAGAGKATVVLRSVAGVPTKGFELSGIALRHSGAPVQTEITVRYADFGGGVNLRINGAAVAVARFGVLGGTQLGGAAIAVEEAAAGSARVGRLRLTGSLGAVTIGGASLLLVEACGTTPAT